MFSKLHNLDIEKELERQCLLYCRTSNKEIIRTQIFLSDNNIPFMYTDTISLSELFYLYNVLTEYLKEKNDSLEKINIDE